MLGRAVSGAGERDTVLGLMRQRMLCEQDIAWRDTVFRRTGEYVGLGNLLARAVQHVDVQVVRAGKSLWLPDEVQYNCFVLLRDRAADKADVRRHVDINWLLRSNELARRRSRPAKRQKVGDASRIRWIRQRDQAGQRGPSRRLSAADGLTTYNGVTIRTATITDEASSAGGDS